MTSPAPSTDVPTDPAEDTPGTGLITSRGHTVIAPAVVQKIAGRAAVDIDEVGAVSRSGLRRRFGRSDDDAPAEADVEVGREDTSIDLTISVLYPNPVAEVAGKVRTRVRRQVKALTGLDVTQVHITVAELATSVGPPPIRVH